ncbi:MAG: Unknown protein [uncultured Thiotrichaceae bacterium]|uniref:Uncharacterized protein n=1 Tax=uncultured Thiotrichaceae bacterium TaxID=298394 RepID=A0A6S6U9A7_9GAMM|nr:MAG: Unknown protein [uncultured Thiotrichaceae bacterium]
MCIDPSDYSFIEFDKLHRACQVLNSLQEGGTAHESS